MEADEVEHLRHAMGSEVSDISASITTGGEWIEVIAQGVPPHIGSPTPGFGYEREDPFADFRP